MELNSIEIDGSRAALEERYELALGRIREFPDSMADMAVREYFSVLKDLVLNLDRVKKEGKKDAEMNSLLFHDLEPENYPDSFLDPDNALRKLGKEKSGILCVWYYEFRGIIPFMFENRLKDVNAILETTIQLYNIFEQEQMNVGQFQQLIMNEHLTDTVYGYIYDYTEEFVADYVENDLCRTDSFAKDIVMNADLTDAGDNSYLYCYGEWITREQLMTARLMAALPEETIVRMARAYTDGYIRGFELTGKDIGKKSTVVCYMPVGFERFMREAVKQFEEAGLKAVINRSPVHMINKKLRGNVKPGFYGASNLQCEFDHREDLCYFWGKKLEEHKLSAFRNACEKNAEALRKLSGNACVEAFGMKAGDLRTSENVMHFSEHQIKVNQDYIQRSHDIKNEFAPDEETSFTIIAWPTPSIAERTAEDFSEEGILNSYRSIFEEFVGINTLPVERWKEIQQRIIDALDRADHVEIKGAGKNETMMTVRLHELKDPAGETNFENCLADVNIPAGEVFTSPALKGTNGVLNAGYVYINGYLFKNLKLRFSEGRVTDYACDNYFDQAEGRKLIKKVILGDMEGLPMGEFAIGTNTKAYAASRKYMIEDKMPVLIAEKTGPHFAVGDTCYSYEEDIETFNPDGKKLIAKENECSALRKSDPEKAYFNVHTDITIPYEELQSITAVSGSSRTDIIRNGRFVLEGTEELNDALEKIDSDR